LAFSSLGDNQKTSERIRERKSCTQPCVAIQVTTTRLDATRGSRGDPRTCLVRLASTTSLTSASMLVDHTQASETTGRPFFLFFLDGRRSARPRSADSPGLFSPMWQRRDPQNRGPGDNAQMSAAAPATTAMSRNRSHAASKPPCRTTSIHGESFDQAFARKPHTTADTRSPGVDIYNACGTFDRKTQSQHWDTMCTSSRGMRSATAVPKLGSRAYRAPERSLTNPTGKV